MAISIKRAGGLPNVSSALVGWFLPISLIKITKKTVNFKIVEEEVELETRGVWQPMSARQLSILPEGQRSWSWFTLHTLPDLNVNMDEIIAREGFRYRVMQKLSYPEYGYYEYHLCLDYQVPSGETYDRK